MKLHISIAGALLIALASTLIAALGCDSESDVGTSQPDVVYTPTAIPSPTPTVEVVGTPTVTPLRHRVYLDKTIEPCTMRTLAGVDPCAIRRQEFKPEDGFYISYDDTLPLSKWFDDDRSPSWQMHMAVRGTGLPNTLQCREEVGGLDSFSRHDSFPAHYDETDLDGEVELFCFVDFAIHEYLVGAGPLILTIGVYRTTRQHDQISYFRDDVVSQLIRKFEGFEWLFWLRPAFNPSVHGFTAFLAWDVQRDSSGEVTAVDGRLLERHEIEPIVKETVKGFESRAERNEGRVGPNASLPLLVRDAYDLRDFYAEVRYYDHPQATPEAPLRKSASRNPPPTVTVVPPTLPTFGPYGEEIPPLVKFEVTDFDNSIEMNWSPHRHPDVTKYVVRWVHVSEMRLDMTDDKRWNRAYDINRWSQTSKFNKSNFYLPGEWIIEFQVHDENGVVESKSVKLTVSTDLSAIRIATVPTAQPTPSPTPKPPTPLVSHLLGVTVSEDDTNLWVEWSHKVDADVTKYVIRFVPASRLTDDTRWDFVFDKGPRVRSSVFPKSNFNETGVWIVEVVAFVESTPVHSKRSSFIVSLPPLLTPKPEVSPAEVTQKDVDDPDERETEPTDFMGHAPQPAMRVEEAVLDAANISLGGFGSGGRNRIAHIAVTASKIPGSGRCNWAPLALSRVDDSSQGRYRNLDGTLQSVAEATETVERFYASHGFDDLSDVFLRRSAEHHVAGGPDVKEVLVCFYDLQIHEYLLGDGPETVTVASRADFFGVIAVHEFLSDFAQFRGDPNFGTHTLPNGTTKEELESKKRRITTYFENEYSPQKTQRVRHIEWVYFLAPYSDEWAHFETWQLAGPSWMLENRDDMTLALRLLTTPHDPEYVSSLSDLIPRIRKALEHIPVFEPGMRYQFPVRVNHVDHLEAYGRSVGTYDTITPAKPTPPHPPEVWEARRAATQQLSDIPGLVPTPGGPPPLPPSNLTATAEWDEQVVLSWQHHGGGLIDSYVILRRSINDEEEFSEIATVPVETHSHYVDDDGVRFGKTYEYVVRSKNVSVWVGTRT